MLIHISMGNHSNGNKSPAEHELDIIFVSQFGTNGIAKGM